MATELCLLSLTQLQQLPQPQENQNQPNPINPAWMWNNTTNKQPQDQDDDSWEVRAFEEDTGNIMGTTWPPRSYHCTFCRREFRSAQALGGHMNVHRRDRARLHQTQPIGSINSNLSSSTSTSSSPSTFIIPTQEFSTNGGLCLLYQLPNPNARVFTPTTVNACAIDSPSTLLTVSPYHHNNLIRQSISFPAAASPSQNTHSSQCSSGRDETSTTVNGTSNNDYSNNNCKDLANEELDLELRLGHKSTASSSSS